MPWPHPRPLRDPRLLWLHGCFIWTSMIQIIFGPPPITMQSTTFGYAATLAFSLLMILCCVMNIYAAFCKSQYNSFGVEMAGTAGFTGVFAIYSVGLIVGLTDWWGTNTAALAIALFIGNAWRCQKLIRRLW